MLERRTNWVHCRGHIDIEWLAECVALFDERGINIRKIEALQDFNGSDVTEARIEFERVLDDDFQQVLKAHLAKIDGALIEPLVR